MYWSSSRPRWSAGSGVTRWWGTSVFGQAAGRGSVDGTDLADRRWSGETHGRLGLDRAVPIGMFRNTGPAIRAEPLIRRAGARQAGAGRPSVETR